MLVKNFFLSSQLTENKLSRRNEMSLDTDYVRNDIHLRFVLQPEWEII